MKISQMLIGGLIIGVAGAVTGLLYAPVKGAKTRFKIARKGKLYRDLLLDNLYDLADSVSHPFEDAEDQTIRLSTKAINKAKKFKAEALQKVNSLNH